MPTSYTFSYTNYIPVYRYRVYIYTHVYSYMYIFKKYIHRVYIYIFTIVYFPGIPPKQAKFASGLVVQLDCKGKTWLRIFFGNLPPKPSNWMVGTTENQHDTVSNGLSQKESIGLSQPSFCRGHVSILGGRGEICVANLFHSQPIALVSQQRW